MKLIIDSMLPLLATAYTLYALETSANAYYKQPRKVILILILAVVSILITFIAGAYYNGSYITYILNLPVN